MVVKLAVLKTTHDAVFLFIDFLSSHLDTSTHFPSFIYLRVIELSIGFYYLFVFYRVVLVIQSFGKLKKDDAQIEEGDNGRQRD